MLQVHHILSTENRDELKAPGSEHGDDTIMVTIDSDGTVQVCYVQ